MKTWVLNGRSYPIHQLAEVAIPPDVSPYEKQVIAFARQWLSGQETFTVHTSGSTGEPKPVFLTRQQMALSARLTCQALGLNAGDRALVCLSATFIAGMMMLVRGFEMGLELTVIDPASRPLEGFHVTDTFDFTAMVPLQLQETLQGTPRERFHLDRMKGILIGGAPVSLAVMQQLQNVRSPLYHTYGMTETVSHIALRRLNGPHRRDDFVPFEGVQLGLDARGCLHITSALTRGETLQTNDLVDLQADGTFRWLGRMDNVINSGGFKVQIEKVETAIESWLLQYQQGHYAGRRFFVGPLPHSHLGQAVVAVIEGEPFAPESPGAEASGAVLRADLQLMLNRYEVPRDVYFVPKLIETPTGKIDRRANLEQISARQLSPSN